LIRYLSSPRTEKEILKLKGASEDDVNTAVTAARRAFEGSWSEIPALERGNLLHKLADLIHRDRRLIASIDAFDNGKV
jgi:aldehyde dehydrogenase (NAD(P)+)